MITTIDQRERKLAASFIGDSSYLILRPNTRGSYGLVHMSTPQQHGFNFPFQVGTNGDDPSLAIEERHEIQRNDIVILGTDGVFDNLYKEQVIDQVDDFMSNNEFNGNSLAKLIGENAFTLSKNKTHNSPFSTNAKLFNRSYPGGKMDDITVVLARIE